MFGLKKCLCIIIIFVLFFSINLYAEKYAVLIIGDEASSEEGTTRTLDNQGNENLIFNLYGEGDERWWLPMPEFWYDTVILYNELIDEGYTDENIFILFGRGYDYEPETWPIAPKYDPEPNITDYPARVEDVENIFTWLRDGNPEENITALTDNNFLFVWTFEKITLTNLNCKVKVFDANTITKKLS